MVILPQEYFQDYFDYYDITCSLYMIVAKETHKLTCITSGNRVHFTIPVVLNEQFIQEAQNENWTTQDDLTQGTLSDPGKASVSDFEIHLIGMVNPSSTTGCFSQGFQLLLIDDDYQNTILARSQINTYVAVSPQIHELKLKYPV